MGGHSTYQRDCRLHDGEKLWSVGRDNDKSADDADLKPELHLEHEIVRLGVMETH